MTLDDNISALAVRVAQELSKRKWIDYVTISNIEELPNDVYKYTDSNGTYYRRITDEPYTDVIYSDEALTIELTRRK